MDNTPTFPATKPQTLGILGAGVWGRTLGQLVTQNGHRVEYWSRSGDRSLEEIVTEANILLSAVSMKGVASVLSQVTALGLAPDTIIVTATKGLDPQTTATAAQLWQQAFPARPVVVLAGPNLSKEIQQGLPAATVVASNDEGAASLVQEVFSSSNFRVYTNPDPLGVELGGTLKNVMAIASGVCDGLQLGTNAKAALLTRGLTEIIRIGTHWGAQMETFYGLSGLGDLLATCNSPLSRNYQVGYQLAQGKTLAEILPDLEGTAEGVNTTQVLIQRAKTLQISVPISYQVHQLLEGKITPKDAVEALMLRDIKPE
ncbi:NAD(P)H-dependent glycerol-3-phosphate dehydrogenase [Laspinema olomoucense]|uniref:NAD(P)H-dependent glycerol-3-phosphate dehydrogenase n=1 Tax=Laspinema olomoucense TaxID=3231600 RepID=UPI0021BB037A|nr:MULTISPECIES: NAD(P)H-dependent glycerol-3-phosphate dehydrogenase [unclassified Laspinema]MCT7990934.1 NAD(P)H-dependent glycerol-3-phosphate dehydrogenase [Laspinema sp. D3a]MCT7995417.1 NAD(P)H-dependent glycerol-3-phosphate dehydrogenase [Laspinema sp. D3c]